MLKMKSLFLLGIVTLMIFAVDTQETWEPFTPEETNFTYTRCMEDHFKGDYELLERWLICELPRDDDKTPCYVKCVLEGLELFNPETNSFKADNVIAQQRAYASYTGATEAEATQLQMALQEAGSVNRSCQAVFDSFMKIRDTNSEIIKKIFLGYGVQTGKIYADNPNIKQENQSVFRFCEKQFYEDGSEEMCAKRHGKTPGVAVPLGYMKCILKGLRYIDRYGKPNTTEVKRDFHEIGVNDWDEKIDELFAGCGTNTESYFRCLWGTTGDFKNKSMAALDYREIRSMDYKYKLKNPAPEYNAKEIKEKVIELDKAAGCKPSPHFA